MPLAVFFIKSRPTGQRSFLFFLRSKVCTFSLFVLLFLNFSSTRAPAQEQSPPVKNTDSKNQDTLLNIQVQTLNQVLENLKEQQGQKNPSDDPAQLNSNALKQTQRVALQKLKGGYQRIQKLENGSLELEGREQETESSKFKEQKPNIQSIIPVPNFPTPNPQLLSPRLLPTANLPPSPLPPNPPSQISNSTSQIPNFPSPAFTSLNNLDQITVQNKNTFASSNYLLRKELLQKSARIWWDNVHGMAAISRLCHPFVGGFIIDALGVAEELVITPKNESYLTQIDLTYIGNWVHDFCGSARYAFVLQDTQPLHVCFKVCGALFLPFFYAANVLSYARPFENPDALNASYTKMSQQLDQLRPQLADLVDQLQTMLAHENQKAHQSTSASQPLQQILVQSLSRTDRERLCQIGLISTNLCNAEDTSNPIPQVQNNTPSLTAFFASFPWQNFITPQMITLEALFTAQQLTSFGTQTLLEQILPLSSPLLTDYHRQVFSFSYFFRQHPEEVLQINQCDTLIKVKDPHQDAIPFASTPGTSFCPQDPGKKTLFDCLGLTLTQQSVGTSGNQQKGFAPIPFFQLPPDDGQTLASAHKALADFVSYLRSYSDKLQNNPNSPSPPFDSSKIAFLSQTTQSVYSKLIASKSLLYASLLSAMESAHFFNPDQSTVCSQPYGKICRQCVLGIAKLLQSWLPPPETASPETDILGKNHQKVYASALQNTPLTAFSKTLMSDFYLLSSDENTSLFDSSLDNFDYPWFTLMIETRAWVYLRFLVNTLACQKNGAGQYYKSIEDYYTQNASRQGFFDLNGKEQSCTNPASCPNLRQAPVFDYLYHCEPCHQTGQCPLISKDVSGQMSDSGLCCPLSVVIHTLSEISQKCSFPPNGFFCPDNSVDWTQNQDVKVCSSTPSGFFNIRGSIVTIPNLERKIQKIYPNIYSDLPSKELIPCLLLQDCPPPNTDTTQPSWKSTLENFLFSSSLKNVLDHLTEAVQGPAYLGALDKLKDIDLRIVEPFNMLQTEEGIEAWKGKKLYTDLVQELMNRLTSKNGFTDGKPFDWIFKLSSNSERDKVCQSYP